MAKKKTIEKNDPAVLLKKLSELREEMRSRSFKVEGAKSKNVKELGNIRKEIARILTELNKKDKK